MPLLIPISDPEDPRIAPYRDIRERDLVGREGRFVAEGEVVLGVLARQSRIGVENCLIAGPRRGSLAPVLDRLPDETPVYIVPQAIMDRVSGFPVHRGIMAIGHCPEPEPLDVFLDRLPEQALVVVCCSIANHDNMGGIFRNAAAFGTDAVLVDAASCDPLYRKAIRVSVGGALVVPFHKGAQDSALFSALAQRGFQQLALSPAGGVDLARVRPRWPLALYLGAEGPGLPQHILARAETLRIPMVGGFDSLNVATACGIALHQLRHGLQA